MADQGPASGTPELTLQTGANAGVFIEVHTANGAQSAITSGVPGGLPGTTSALNNVGPGTYQGGVDPSAYGTRFDGSPVTPLFLNLQSTLPNVTSIIKNPA
jgi:hypothetical protein